MKIDNKGISIIGGAGHVGFPLGLAFAEKKFNVNLVDINFKNLELIKKGISPYKEKNVKSVLSKCIKNRKLFFSRNLNNIVNSRFIVVCIGTPVNNQLKPELKYFLNFIKNLKKKITKKNIIIIRSSIYPGIINKIENIFGDKNNKIVYCPERIVQGLALEELPRLPQIIASNNNLAKKEVKKIFKKICFKLIETSVLEAELIKLFSNANRYINFAIANQLFLICEQNSLSFAKIRNIMRDGYERNVNLPYSGLTAGPCLLKDTMQLSSFFKGDFSLGLSAMKINESFPDHIIKKIKSFKNYKRKKVGVLGLSFKSESDDIRDSLAIKLLKKLKKNKIKFYQSDEFYKNIKNVKKEYLVKKSDIIVLGAPHKVYKKLKMDKKKLIDVWGFLKKI